jgi:putative flippase GtrA
MREPRANSGVRLSKAGLSVVHADPSGQAKIALGSAARLSGTSPLHRAELAEDISPETPPPAASPADLTMYEPTGADRTRQHPELSIVTRIARFLAVGGTCYFIQLGLLHSIASIMALYIADVLAFMASAQVNFTLSRLFTWGDRQGAEKLPLRWLKFNLNAALSVTVVNAAIFWMLVSVGLQFWGAMLLANIASACSTFAVNHYLVFTRAREKKPDPRIT